MIIWVCVLCTFNLNHVRNHPFSCKMVIISSIILKWVVPLRTTIKQYCIDLNCGYLLTWVISDNPCQNFWYRLLSNISLRWQWQLRVQLTERQLVCKHRGTLTSHHTTAPLPSCSVTLRSSYLSCQPADPLLFLHEWMIHHQLQLGARRILLDGPNINTRTWFKSMLTLSDPDITRDRAEWASPQDVVPTGLSQLRVVHHQCAGQGSHRSRVPGKGRPRDLIEALN